MVLQQVTVHLVMVRQWFGEDTAEPVRSGAGCGGAVPPPEIRGPLKCLDVRSRTSAHVEATVGCGPLSDVLNLQSGTSIALRCLSTSNWQEIPYTPCLPGNPSSERHNHGPWCI